MLTNETGRLIPDLPDSHRAAFEKLHGALVGHDLAGRRIPGREARQLFDEAVLALRPVLDHASAEQRAYLARRRTKLFRAEADDRVENSLILDKKIVEIPDDQHPREQAAVFRLALPKLIETLQIANEQLLRLDHEHLEEAIEHLEKGGHANGIARLAMLHSVLGMADGWLTLKDEELQHKLGEVQHVLPGVTNFAELVKAIVEIGISAVSLTASLAAAIAKITGDAALSSAAMGVASETGHLLGNVVAGIEVVHGIFVLLDPAATRAEKERAAFGVASGGAFFAGKRIGGAAMGAAASFAVVATYVELKIAAYLYWQGALGINSVLMTQAFEYMQQQGASMARVAGRVTRAGLLLEQEHDAHKADSLAKSQSENAAMLATIMDDFLQHCLPSGKDMGFGSSDPAAWPGNSQILAEAFGPLQSLRGIKSGPALVAAAGAVLEKITWCLQHAGEIEVTATHHGHLPEVEKAIQAAQGQKE